MQRQPTMATATHWYFAYGSNLHRSIFVEQRKMQPLAVRWGWLDGYRLCFNIPVGPGERGVANIEVEMGARTCGALYLLAAAECDRLDRTEGVHRGLYQRITVPVLAESGDVIEAFAYQSSLTQPGRKPSPRYMGLILEGAKEHGLPAGYVELLTRFELAVDERESANKPKTDA
ncbi:MAG: gamma-glutamylcyclotransferase [Deltaproteobacteria bacterium]|nr:gamma-glutamylcyclotransferase [Deltaproteobacteria bacterium]